MAVSDRIAVMNEGTVVQEGHSDYSEATLPSAGFGPGPTNNPNKMNFHGSALGNSFGEYSSGLLHDD